MDIFQKFETILPKPLGLSISTDLSKLCLPQCYGKREDRGLTGYTSCLNLSLYTRRATASQLQHNEQAGMGKSNTRFACGFEVQTSLTLHRSKSPNQQK